MSFPIHLLSQRYSYMFYLGLLVPPCTHTEGPRSPRPVTLFTLNYRVFVPSSRTFVRRPWSSSVIPGLRRLSRVFFCRPGSSSFVPGLHSSSFDPFSHIYSRVRFGRSGLITYFSLVVPNLIDLSQNDMSSK